MEIHPPDIPSLIPTPEHVAELDRLGDAIAELAAHLEAATARLLDLICEFDARGGWGNGFRSCAHWLSWRIGLTGGPAAPAVPADPVQALRAQHDAQGLRLEARTTCPSWLGELDVGYAIDVLHPLATPRRV